MYVCSLCKYDNYDNYDMYVCIYLCVHIYMYETSKTANRNLTVLGQHTASPINIMDAFH